MNTSLCKFTLALLCFIFTACSGSDENGNETGFAEKTIKFRSTETETRASRATDLSKVCDNFIVQGTKDMGGTAQTVMPGYEVRHNGSDWYYDGIGTQSLKFWDMAAKAYTFAAIAPKPAADSDNFTYQGVTTAISSNGDITINGIKGNASTGDSPNSADAPDWMVAKTTRSCREGTTLGEALDLDDSDGLLSPGAQQPFSAPRHPVADLPLCFHHIFSRVEFKAYSAKGTITLSRFKVMVPEENTDNIINQGNYTTRRDGSTGEIIGWTDKTAATNDDQDPKRFGDYTYLEGLPIGSSPENAILLASHVEIPQEWLAAGRMLEVTCITTDEKEYHGVIVLNEENNGTNSWLQDKRYTYLLRIDAESTDEVILFEVDMDEWKWEQGNTSEQTQGDW